MGALSALRPQPDSSGQGVQFLTVAEAAVLVRLSKMTLYRAIHDGEFPAVQIRGRFIVPAQAIDEMAKAAMASRHVVNAADWVTQPSADDSAGYSVAPLEPLDRHRRRG